MHKADGTQREINPSSTWTGSVKILKVQIIEFSE
jgi:hypothetical protein